MQKQEKQILEDKKKERGLEHLKGSEYTLKFFSDGFFGYGEDGSFTNGSLAYILPIAITIAVIVCIYRYKDKLRCFKHEGGFRISLISLMLLSEMGYFWRLLYVGPGGTLSEGSSLMSYLPIQVCEWTLFIAVFMLIAKSENVFHLAFSLVLSCNIIPLIVPDTVLFACGPDTFRYYQYWLEHLLPIISVFYAMYVYGFRPKKIGILMALAELTVLYVLCYKANLFLRSLGEREFYMYFYILRKIPLLADAGPVEMYLIIAMGYIALAFIPHLIYGIICRVSRNRAKASCSSRE